MAGTGGVAEKIRTGLGSTAMEPSGRVAPTLTLVYSRASDAGRDPLDELWVGKPVRQHVMEFGQVFALLGVIIAGFMAYYGRPAEQLLLPLGFSLFAAWVCRSYPKQLRPVWSGWMKGAMILGGVVTAILLSIMWAFIIIPIALLLRVIGKKVMDTEMNISAKSYWIDRTDKQNDFKLLERQF